MEHTHEPVDVEALAVQAADGDAIALDALLVEIQPRVRRICGRMLLYPEDAGDPRAQAAGVTYPYKRAEVAQMTAFQAKAAGDAGADRD